MAFVKVVKNKAYFKRYQVKYRRRREGKTDYHARRQMVLQDKTKYGSPKYRLVVRIMNRDIIAQIVHAKISGDQVLMAAYSHELPAFGINLGLTNYAAAYATGLLLARRLLAKLHLSNLFEGVLSPDGKYNAVRTKKDDDGDSESRFPFKAILDVGLARTTTGARVFAVMKGAVDGGLAIPHRENRFPGYNKETGKLDDRVHRARIFGQHVGTYLKQVVEENAMSADEPITQFSKYIAAKINPDGMEAMYKKAHEAIRANPMQSVPSKTRTAGTRKRGERPVYQTPRLSKAVREQNIRQKIATLRERLTA